MTLRRKNQMALGIVMLILLSLLDFTFTGIIRQAAEKTDRERMLLNLSRAVVSINGEAQSLSAIAGNWAFSDVTWNYMHNKDSHYVTNTLNRAVLTDIGISSIILVDKDNSVRLFKDYSPKELPSAPQNEFRAIFDDPNNEKLLQNVDIEGISGISEMGGAPILFCIKPILKSDKSGPSVGYLIATKNLGPSMIQGISRNLHFTFSVEEVSDKEKENKNIPLTKVHVAKGKASSVTGSMLMRDQMGAPAFWVNGISKKEDTTEAESTLQKLFLIMAAFSLLICVIYDFIFKQIFYKRMTKLQKEAEDIRDEKTGKENITVDSTKDELASLQRVISDIIAYKDYSRDKKDQMDSLSLMVYERFAEAGNRLCYKTLEDIAVAFTPGDDKFKNCIPRAAIMTRKLSEAIGLCREEQMYAYLGALFSRIGLIGIPFALRLKTTPMTAQELREYRKYPLIAKDMLSSIELLRPAAQIPFSWNENWDGSGYPHGYSASAIPVAARIFAVVDAWNELTRPWPGRKLPLQQEIEDKLRSMAGTRLDPQITEKFIKFLQEHEKK